MAPKDTGAGDRRSTWTTALTSVEPTQVLVRGYRIDELMGRVSFGEALYLLLTGELPSPGITRLVNAILTGLIDHGVTPPPTMAARHAASTGAPMPSAVAAGLLAFGPRYGGGVVACRALLEEGLDLAGSSLLLASAAADLAERLVQTDRIPPPGFGSLDHATDPRVMRLLQMALELEMEGLYTQFLRALSHALSRHPALEDMPLPIAIEGAVAAVGGDLGLSPQVAEALLVISRVPGLVAHTLEEQARDEPGRIIDPLSHRYDGPGERRVRG